MLPVEPVSIRASANRPLMLTGTVNGAATPGSCGGCAPGAGVDVSRHRQRACPLGPLLGVVVPAVAAVVLGAVSGACAGCACCEGSGCWPRGLSCDFVRQPASFLNLRGCSASDGLTPPPPPVRYPRRLLSLPYPALAWRLFSVQL